MPLQEMIHMTAAYSNAVLTAIMPHVSDVATKLDLPIAPVGFEQVAHFNPSPFTNNVGGGLWLTNGYWFVYSFGVVDSFRSPDNWFAQQELEGVERLVGKDNMTTNDAIAFARKSFVKLGYDAASHHLNDQPSEVQGPFDVKGLGHIPYCRIVWESPEGGTPQERINSYNIRFDVDLQKKMIVGMQLAATNFWRDNLKIGITPEFESDYRKRIQGTNAPPN